MKKLLLLSAMLFVLFAKAQDQQTINLMAQSSSLDQVKAVSDKIALSANDKFEYLKTGDGSLREEKYKVVFYKPIGLSIADKTKLTQEEKSQCLKVYWYVTDSGFTFKEVNSPEQNLLPFWKATFAADTEYRVNKDLKYKFVKNEETASIVKSY